MDCNKPRLEGNDTILSSLPFYDVIINASASTPLCVEWPLLSEEG